MRQLLVRLGLDPSRFVSGIRGALASWQGFRGEFINIGRAIESFVGNLAANIANQLIGAISAIPRAITGLFEGAINAALAEERLGAQMRVLTGDAGQAADIMERLDEWTLRVGANGDDAAAAAGDIAKALRAVNGEVDPDLLFQYMDTLQLLSAGTGRSMGEMSEAFGRVITGDVEMLSRMLGISREQLAQMSPTLARFLEQTQQAGEQALGAVTSIAGDTGMASADAMQVLNELMASLGLSQDDLEAWGDTAQAEINRFNESLDQLKEELGAELLPILTSVLHEINTFIAENREEISAMIDRLGDFTATEWKEFARALQRVDWAGMGTSGVGFLEAASGIDWIAIADAVNAMVDFVQLSSGLLGTGAGAALHTTAPATSAARVGAGEAIGSNATAIQVILGFDGSLEPVVRSITRSEAASATAAVIGGARRGGRSREQ